MKNKYLKPEIKALLSNAEKVLGKDSIQYKKLDFYLDTLVTVYEFNYDSEKDLLRELKALLAKLSKQIPELSPEQFKEKYPSISQMIVYLDEWLTN
jgi:superfamily I DNA and/or RNA helicase